MHIKVVCGFAFVFVLCVCLQCTYKFSFYFYFFLCSGNLSYGLRNTPSATLVVCD